MILFIFRLVSLLSLAGLIAFLLIGQFDTNSVKLELDQSNVKHRKLILQLEIDKNESENALSSLFRVRGDFRDKEEVFLGKIKDLKAEVDGFAPKQTQLDKFDHYLVPIGNWHQIKNSSDDPCHIIEIQYGTDCIESDIERLDKL